MNAPKRAAILGWTSIGSGRWIVSGDSLCPRAGVRLLSLDPPGWWWDSTYSTVRWAALWHDRSACHHRPATSNEWALTGFTGTIVPGLAAGRLIDQDHRDTEPLEWARLSSRRDAGGSRIHHTTDRPRDGRTEEIGSWNEFS